MIVIDAETGRVLSEMNADAITYPASLTKMMTLYLTFEALNSGRLGLDQYLPVSSEAASKSPTKLHLVPGDSVQVHDLILGIVTKSANDAAAVLAEGLAGSEPAFADRMTAKARQLGMTSTVYRNASGLPDPEQRTTARDVAQLALALYHDFPREYRYFATREFFFRGRVILTHNHLLDWYEGADGIKTGYIGASGFNLAASAVRNGHRLIGVVMGGASAGSRDREMAALLDQGFAEVGAGPTLVARREAPAPSAAPVVAETDMDQPEPVRPREKIGQLAKAARKIAAHLSPVAKAEAAPIPHQLRTPGNRSLEHPARCVPRRECGRAGGAFRRCGARSQRQAGTDRAALEGRQGARLPCAPPQLFAARSAGRVRRAPQKEDRVFGGPAGTGQGCHPLNRVGRQATLTRLTALAPLSRGAGEEL